MATVTVDSAPSGKCLTRKRARATRADLRPATEDLKPIQRQGGNLRRTGRARWRRAGAAGAGWLAIAAATALRSISGVIGFRRKSVAPSRMASTASSIDAKAVDHQDAGIRRALLDLLQRFEAVEPRHLLIEHDGVVLAAVTKAIQPGLAVGGFVHLVAGRFERQAHHVPDMGFVVDDRAASHGPAALASVPERLTDSRTVNVNVDPRPGSDWTVSRPPCPSTIRREIVKPSPAPPPDACGTCTNGSKILGQVVARDPRAGVGDRNRDLVAAARCRDGDRAAGRRGAHGVGDQIADHAFDLAPIHGHVRQVGRRVDVQADAARFHLQAKRGRQRQRGASPVGSAPAAA